jgi:formate hydrogenlyase subunit 3/multisubunit Na+/H+ antiporter MnhD subunit
VPFRVRKKKKFFRIVVFFFLFFAFKTHHARCVRTTTTTTQTEEKERERERPLFPFYASKNALLGALCVCAGVHKKTILINLNTTSAQLFISFGYLMDFLLSSFWNGFEGHVSPPVFP